MKARPKIRDIIDKVNNIVNFCGLKIIVGSTNTLKRRKRALAAKAIRALG